MKLPILTSFARPSQRSHAYKINNKTTDNLWSSIRSIVNSSVAMDRKPRVLNHNGISISQTGFAKQFLL
ncbi:hypothetical protein KB20921_13780 [Edwardsiella ictaluri]|nr:hypothetical protein KH20906_13500 [Edwardsiella ictaluri]BEI02117.1 hypothetical protein KB20921_13780 [Edwardsiella ictaluri]BEI05585.1 hypothetical protein KH201010_13710 [Edwardsiella ictaluri]BEI09043.1 hypothetical protein STU22726_13740 [Edwardsiella ictaluri]BEI12523.1 hypothetical protein STU22816_13760 [Edwardsiella ictaluri]